jgi:hypothetical protein
MRAAAGMQPSDFVATHIMGGEPYVFRANASQYADLRAEVGLLLDTPPASVLLIGSAQVGFSLNADHLLSIFGPTSDLDLVVVNAAAFDGVAMELLTRAEDFALTGEDEKRRFRRSRDNTFYGLVRPDQLPVGCSLSREWFPRLAGPFRHPLARAHSVRAWLFRSLDHARLLYTNHHRRVQPAIVQILTQRGDI